MNTPAEWTLLVIGAMIGWVIVTQIVGGLIVAMFGIRVNEENQFAMHLLFSLWPFFLLFFLLAWLKRFNEQFGFYYRLRKTRPSDDLMDYIGQEE